VEQRYGIKVWLKGSAQCSNFSGGIAAARSVNNAVMTGPDPAIHLHETLTTAMETRLKPAYDDRKAAALTAISST
jgi:hypothetical protein